MDADQVVVWLARRKHKVRAFLDSGAQVCFITKRMAKVLQPVWDGLKFKYMKVMRKWVEIQTCQIKKGKLPITLADQTPNVCIGYKDNEVAVDLWIAPNSENAN